MLLHQLYIILPAAFASALPAPSVNFPRAAHDTAAAMLLQISPGSGSCSGAPAAGECATNTQAAPFLVDAMNKYGITSFPEIAAVLSVIAYETADFKYNINHFPGRAGQGTRNMQMAPYNLLYARSIPILATQLSAITTASTTNGLSDDQLNAIRALVLPDEYSWASAAWFLTTQCSTVRSALQAGGQSGYNAYLSCIGVTATPERLAYYTRATAALGIS